MAHTALALQRRTTLVSAATAGRINLMAGWLINWDVEHRALVANVAKGCSFTEIRVIRDVSGLSGAKTFIVQPVGLAGVPGRAVLKIGRKEIIAKDAEGLQ